MKHLQLILGTIAICTCSYAKEIHGYSIGTNIPMERIFVDIPSKPPRPRSIRKSPKVYQDGHSLILPPSCLKIEIQKDGQTLYETFFIIILIIQVLRIQKLKELRQKSFDEDLKQYTPKLL